MRRSGDATRKKLFFFFFSFLLACENAFSFITISCCCLPSVTCGPVSSRLNHMCKSSSISNRKDRRDSGNKSAAIAALVQEERDMGKIVLVTGCNSGMGAATAAHMLKRGAHVICVSRDAASTTSALQQHGTVVAGGDVQPRSFSCISADFTSLDSVRSAAAEITKQYGEQCLDVLVANAGIMAPPFARTVDGFESQMQVNFLSQFLLLRLLAASRYEGSMHVRGSITDFCMAPLLSSKIYDSQSTPYTGVSRNPPALFKSRR